jgi:hypothetical protein
MKEPQNRHTNVARLNGMTEPKTGTLM